MNAQQMMTAQLIFEGERYVSLPKVATILEDHLTGAGHGSVQRCEASLTAVCITADTIRLMLDMAFENGETVLSLSASDDGGETAALAVLAGALYPVAAALPAQWVVWAGTDLRIPREAFVTGLAAQFGGDIQPEADTSMAPLDDDDTSNITPIAPRRVASAGGRTIRPLAKAPATIQLASSLPGGEAVAQLAPANANASLMTRQYDDHVHAYERHLRKSLLRPVDADEIIELRNAAGIIPIEARLSTWAVSLTVATVSLPVAAPVMIYNIARGEDMRVASLAMGIAGLFIALDSSGAMASVTGL